MEENVIATQEIDMEWDEVEAVEAEVEAEPVEEVDQPQVEQQEQPVELFTLKNRDETRQVNKDELVAMAQKGWDYDTVRQERDQLRQYKNEANPALELVRTYAQRNGMELNEYLDFCRKQDLVRSGLSEEAAAEKLGIEKERAAFDAERAAFNAEKAEKESLARQEQEKAEARQKDFEAFIAAYPGIDPNSIPKEVWVSVQNGESLMVAYTKHENARLKAELAAERQNKVNQQKTPGSLGGNAVNEMDEIDRIWAEDD